ncbi:MAG: SemiSWEET transporter [Coleofasciculaceae cyanobacterium SM2_3_26]|nr:SemiSWEET transporter [Coleofasciculaceae cyanobacterium SM2_3_26]
MRYSVDRLTEAVGILAACLTTCSFFPQALKTIRDKNTEGISLTMYAMFTAGIFFWFVYGLCRGDRPVIVANFVTFIPAATVLYLKMRHLRRRVRL